MELQNPTQSFHPSDRNILQPFWIFTIILLWHRYFIKDYYEAVYNQQSEQVKTALTWRIICSFWTLPSYGQVTTSQAVHYYVFYKRDHFNRMGEFGWGSCSKHSSHFEMKTMGLTLLHRELVKINTRLTFVTEWKTPSNLRGVWNTLTFFRGWVKVSVVSIVCRNLWIVASSLHKHPWQAGLCSRKQDHRYGSSLSHYMSIQSPKILECVELIHKYRFWSTSHTFGQSGWWAATDYSWQCHC